MWEKFITQNFYKSICQKDWFCAVDPLESKFAKVEQILIPHLTSLEQFSEFLNYFLTNKQTDWYVYERYLESILFRVLNVVWTFGSCFYFHFKEWTVQSVRL